MPPRPINVIFQGGGAKLATLIAACEALEELEGEEITINEVAGTSAGAISAFMLAHKMSSRELRIRFKDAASGVIELFDKKKVGLSDLIWLRYGGTIFDEDVLRLCLRKVFGTKEDDKPNNKKKDVTLSDARVPVFVRVTYLPNGSASTYKSTDTDTERSACDILTEACAIPIAFRSFKSASPYVDGGLITNLVEPQIFSDPKVRVIAFSFENPGAHEYKNLSSYLATLASIAIDANVLESIVKVQAEGGHVCYLPNDFGTFDFRKALDIGLTDDYVRTTKPTVKAGVKAALQEFDRRERRREERDNIVALSAFQSGFSERLSKVFPWGVASCAIICVAHGLSDDTHPDTMVKDVTIIAHGDAVLAFRIGISRDEAFELGRDVNWEIFDKDGNKLCAIQEIVESVQDGAKVWHACFCLDSPVPKSSCPLRVKLVTTHMGLMRSLLKPGGTEWMRAGCHATDRMAVQDFVLCSPRSFGRITMVDLLENGHRATNPPKLLADLESKWRVGRRLSDEELATYRSAFVYLAGFDFFGWRAQDVPSGFFSGTLIERLEMRA